LRFTRLIAGALAGVTTLTVIAGCASDSLQALEPKLELRNAAKQLGEAKQAGFTIKINGSADDLVAAAKLDAAKSGDKADEVTEDDAKVLRQLFNSSFTVAYDQAGEGTDDDRALFGATIDGVSGTEVRFANKTLFVKAPVEELATKFGASAEEVKTLSDEAVGSLGGLDELFAGKWVSIDSTKLTELAQSGAGVDAKAVEEQKLKTELSTAAENLLQGATIVRDENDDTHLVVTSSTTKAYEEFKRVISAVEPTMAETLTGASAEPVADKPIVLDLWIKDGKLTAAEINMLQFIDGATGRVALRIEVTTGAAIDVPEGATKIDVDALLGATPGAGLGAKPGAGADTELSEEDLKELEELLGGVTPAATS
jgi:outer membrane murein-binding lipoprotein Lpp